MCIETMSSLASNVALIADRVSSNASRVATASVGQGLAPTPGEVAGIIDQPVIDAGIAAFQDALSLLDDAHWGEAVPIDDGETPRWFGYGEASTTLGEIGGEAGPLVARARAFGEQSADEVRAAIGGELELGLHGRDDALELFGVELGRADAFPGLRGRAVAEHGCLGARAGEELFLGASLQGKLGRLTGGPGAWSGLDYSLDLGASESLTAQISAVGLDFYAGARAGLDLRLKAVRHQPLIGTLGIIGKTDVNAALGAMAGVEAGVGPTGAGVEAGAFAGARLGLQQGFAAALGGQEILGGFVEGEVWAGAGATFETEFEFEDGRLELGYEAGAALGLGGKVGGGISIGTVELGGLFDLP